LKYLIAKYFIVSSPCISCIGQAVLGLDFPGESLSAYTQSQYDVLMEETIA